MTDNRFLSGATQLLVIGLVLLLTPLPPSDLKFGVSWMSETVSFDSHRNVRCTTKPTADFGPRIHEENPGDPQLPEASS